MPGRRLDARGADPRLGWRREPLPAGRRRDPAGDVARALLRPRLRLRRHAGLAPPARAPHVERRRPGRGRPARRVVVVELHDLGHERARPRVARRAAAGHRASCSPACSWRSRSREAFGAARCSSPAPTSPSRSGRHTFLTFAAGAPGTLERERAGRILIWFVASGALWLAGALADGPARTALWLAALALDYGGAAGRVPRPRPAAGWRRRPGTSRPRTSPSASSSSSSSRWASRSS